MRHEEAERGGEQASGRADPGGVLRPPVSLGGVQAQDQRLTTHYTLLFKPFEEAHFLFSMVLT